MNTKKNLKFNHIKKYYNYFVRLCCIIIFFSLDKDNKINKQSFEVLNYIIEKSENL